MADQATLVRTDPVAETLQRLKQIFRSAPTKRAAHEQSAEVVRGAATNPEFLTSVLRSFVSDPKNLERENYPVIGIVVESNPDFDFVAHAWIPHPDGETDLSTKAIHHHGELMLTTATAFGPGYEHWTFTTPERMGAGDDRFSMQLIDRGMHELHEVAFVDAGIAHVPMFPPGLTVTYCLWSNRGETTWKDNLKRVPVIQRHSGALRRVVTRLGLARQLAVTNVEYFDFHPTPAGFVGMPEREEFRRGPNADHVRNLLFTLRESGNQELADDVERSLAAGPVLDDPAEARELLEDLRADRPIVPRLSHWHHGAPEANFRAADIQAALQAVPD